MSDHLHRENLLWEGSRMMLPEHKAGILRYRTERNKKEKPELDQQKLEDFVRTIGVSMFTEQPVRITVYGEYEDTIVVGKIDKILTETKTLKVGVEDSFEWIKLEDVLKMEIEI